MLIFQLTVTLLGVWLPFVRGQTTPTSSLTKIPPPPNRGTGSYPAFYIYKDVDEIARPGGKLDVCSNVKTIRSACYNLGIKEKNYAAEQECLCAQQAALAITQCFAQQYEALTDGGSKSQLRQSFLYYTYDCFCGVEEVDPTYNTTASPVEPFVEGYTGDPILPPVEGCPVKGAPPNVCPVPPPCTSCEVPRPPIEAPCSAGNNRCSGVCIPECPAPVCKFPKFAHKGECVCPCGWEAQGDDSCIAPTCGPNEEYVVGPGCSGQCVCQNGYEWAPELEVCQEICPVGQSRPSPSAPCETPCTEPEIEDWDGNCVCSYSLGYTVNENGECVLFECEPPLKPVPYYQSCFCPDPYYVSQVDGSCIEPLCFDTWNAECYPDRFNANDTVAIAANSAPPVSAFENILSDVASPVSAATVSEEGSRVTPAPEPTNASSTTEEAQPPNSAEEPIATPSPQNTPTDEQSAPPEETPQQTPEQTPEPVPEEPTPDQPIEEQTTAAEPSAGYIGRRLRWARNL